MHIFDPTAYCDNSNWVLYIDLDMIITGSLDGIASMAGGQVKAFATLTTAEIFCENVDNGYNSSVMLFDRLKTQHLFQVLDRYYDYLLKYLMRFDHYLEMLVHDAQIIQQLVPGQLIDYSQHFIQNKQKDLPANCRIVAFPRNPKPHEISDEWAKHHWIY